MARSERDFVVKALYIRGTKLPPACICAPEFCLYKRWSRCDRGIISIGDTTVMLQLLMEP